MTSLDPQRCNVAAQCYEVKWKSGKPQSDICDAGNVLMKMASKQNCLHIEEMNVPAPAGTCMKMRSFEGHFSPRSSQVFGHTCDNPSQWASMALVSR